MKLVNLKSKIAIPFKSEFWMNLLLAAMAIIVGFYYAHGTHDYFTKDWFEDLGKGSFFIMFFGNFVLRTIAAGSREKSGARTKEIHAAMMALKQRNEIDQKIARFLSFLKNESQHNIRLLDIGDEAWEYNISPERDENGDPKFLDDEINKAYVIKVNEIAHYSVRSDEDLKIYEKSPIRTSEYYFCSFYNEDWYMSDSEGPGGYRFKLSSKMGQCKNTEYANSYLGKTAVDEAAFTKLDVIIVNDEGVLSDSGSSITLFSNKDGHVYLRYYNSLMKRLYFRNKKDAPDEWFLEIDYPDGYAHGHALINLLNTLKRRLDELGVKPQKMSWYKVDRVMKREH